MQVWGAGALVAAMMLTGCVPDTGPSAPANPVPTACDAAEWQEFVGQPVHGLETATWEQPVRFIRPMTPITEDYSEERLNFDIDANEKISRIWCG